MEELEKEISNMVFYEMDKRESYRREFSKM